MNSPRVRFCKLVSVLTLLSVSSAFAQGASSGDSCVKYLFSASVTSVTIHNVDGTQRSVPITLSPMSKASEWTVSLRSEAIPTRPGDTAIAITSRARVNYALTDQEFETALHPFATDPDYVPSSLAMLLCQVAVSQDGAAGARPILGLHRLVLGNSRSSNDTSSAQTLVAPITGAVRSVTIVLNSYAFPRPVRSLGSITADDRARGLADGSLSLTDTGMQASIRQFGPSLLSPPPASKELR
ncbi:MAG TPA: hypothetical protein VNA88_08120 [Candidatus Kapabacteria bacterium]|nr:hypothetical protein [Candidatus Kapabacteria bacterium]